MQGSKNPNKTHNPQKQTPSNPCPTVNNNFNFLMQSIDRQKFTNYLNNTTSIDKQNQQDNEGRYSIKIRTIKNDRNDSGMARSSFLQAGSFLAERDGVAELREKEKERGKDYKLVESLLYKLKKYLAITEVMLHQPAKIQEKLRKNGINTACQLIELINACEQAGIPKRGREDSTNCSLNSTGNLVLGSNKSLSSSFHFPNGLSNSLQDPINFIRKIQNLEQQKLQLESLISQHERANIKMFIKLNQGQSQQIQKYKKLLSSLFQKYKQLQKLVKSESQKSKNLQLVIDGLKNKRQCSRLCQVNMSQMRKKIVGFEQLIQEQNQYLSRALEEIEELKRKIEIYQNMQNQYMKLLSQMQKSRHAARPVPSNDHCQDTFAGIMLKNNGKATTNEQSLYRVLFMQSSFIDSVLRR